MEFIGLDINIKDVDGKKSAAASSRKRPRPQSSTASAKRPKRPSPTPAPPAALVSLIQKDSTVLNYFKSLQENLDYDVDKWKAEAQRWKKIAEEKSGGLAVVKNNGQNSTITSAAKKKESAGGKTHPGTNSIDELQNGTQSISSSRESKHDYEAHRDDGSNIPITDEALFGGSDDSEDDMSCFGESDAAVNSTTQVQEKITDTSRRPSVVLEKLKEAKECLDLLGVSLVEVEVKTIIGKQLAEAADIDEAAGETSGASLDDEDKPYNGSTATIERTLRRQSDEIVVGDIMASLRTLIRTSANMAEANPHDAKRVVDSYDDVVGKKTENAVEDDEIASDEQAFWSESMHMYHPFRHNGVFHMPTVYWPGNSQSLRVDANNTTQEHPAAVGLNYIINILLTMGMYCSDILSDGEWDALFGSVNSSIGDDLHEEELLILKVGMRNRCRITNRVLSSLHTEITRIWALTDRASYLTEPSLFFHESDVTEFLSEPQSSISSYLKIYNRLVSLEERIAHARIATLLHRLRDDWQKAAELVVGYVISCAPSVGVEDHPKLSPALSLCVLEALLSSKGQRDEDVVEGWFQKYVDFLLSASNGATGTDKASRLLSAIALPVHTAALIWKERSFSTDGRIRDIALIELAAFERIQQSTDGQWLNKVNVKCLDAGAVENVSRELYSVKDLVETNESYTTFDFAVPGIICAISLLTVGDIDKVFVLFEEALKDLSRIPLYCSIYVSLMNRKWDALKLGNRWGRQTAAAFTLVERFAPILGSAIQLVSPANWKDVNCLLQCCVLMGDGSNLLRIAHDTMKSLLEATYCHQNSHISLQERQMASRALVAFIDLGKLPTVRVINLKRRPDRLLDFMAFASKEQLIVIKGPVAVKQLRLQNDDFVGDYAFDGQCSCNELASVASLRLGGRMSDFVTAKWRPADLQAFDRDARKSHDLIEASSTEKACALSHIACWIGVQRTLSEFNSSDVVEGTRCFED